MVKEFYGHNENHLKLLLDLILKDGAIDPTTIRRSRQLGYDDEEIEKVIIFTNELSLSNNLHLACLRTKNLHTNTLIPNPLSRLIAKLMIEYHGLTLKTMDERLLSIQPEIIFELVTRSHNPAQNQLVEELMSNYVFLSDKKDLLIKVIELSNYIHNNMDISCFASMIQSHSISTIISPNTLPTNYIETICSLSNRIHEEPLSVACIGLIIAQFIQHKVTKSVEYPMHTHLNTSNINNDSRCDLNAKHNDSRCDLNKVGTVKQHSPNIHDSHCTDDYIDSQHNHAGYYHSSQWNKNTNAKHIPKTHDNCETNGSSGIRDIRNKSTDTRTEFNAKHYDKRSKFNSLQYDTRSQFNKKY